MTHEFTKTTWVDGTTAITSAQLNRIEEGVEQAHISTISPVAANVSGADYPIGVTMFGTSGDSSWPFSSATVLNIKNSSNRFTQWVYQTGLSDAKGAAFRHWHTTDGWSVFQRADDPIEQNTNTNGSYVRFADGWQECWKNDVTISYIGTTAIQGTWTYPAAFTSAPSVAFNLGALGTITPTETQLAAPRVSSISTTSASLRQPRVSGTVDFQSGESAEGRAKAVGWWK